MEWQPIETAPRNPEGKFYGPVILVWNSADNMPWPASWQQAIKTDDATEGAWFVCDDASADPEIASKYVTHWMPLPAPPKAGEQ